MLRLAARRGIAVIELVVVALIVAVLLAIAIPRFTRPTLDVVQGPGASIRAGSSGPLAVRVTSWRGAAQAGVPVEFVAADGIAVTPTIARTDSAGVARATWFAGPEAGTATIRAHVEGRDLPSVTIATRSTAVAPAAPAPSVAPPAAGGDTTRRDAARGDAARGDTAHGDAAAPPAAP